MTNLQIICRESNFANLKQIKYIIIVWMSNCLSFRKTLNYYNYLFKGLANLTGLSNKSDLTSTVAQCSDILLAGTNVSLFKEKSPFAWHSLACKVRPTKRKETQSMWRESYESLTRNTLSCCPASNSSASLDVMPPQYQPCLKKF